MTDINKIFDSFQGLSVMIIGDVMIDAYTWGKADRMSPEAPVPVVDVFKKENRLGGAANVAKNIKAMGAKSILCSVVGDDDYGQVFFNLLGKNQISPDFIYKSNKRRTTVKHRILTESEQVLRIDEEDKFDLDSEENNRLLSVIEEELDNVDVIILQDYDKGVLNDKNISKIIEKANKLKIPITVDPKKKNFTKFKNVTLFKPNLKEIKEGLSIDIDIEKNDSIVKGVKQLKSELDIKNVLLTLSEKGVYVDFDEKQELLPTLAKDIADVSGAGDTVISIASLLIALNVEPSLIGKLSNLAGGLVCEEMGVVPVDKKKFKEKALRL